MEEDNHVYLSLKNTGQHHQSCSAGWFLSEDFYDLAGDILNPTQHNHTQPLYLAKTEWGSEEKCLEVSSMWYQIGWKETKNMLLRTTKGEPRAMLTSSYLKPQFPPLCNRDAYVYPLEIFEVGSKWWADLTVYPQSPMSYFKSLADYCCGRDRGIHSAEEQLTVAGKSAS